MTRHRSAHFIGTRNEAELRPCPVCHAPAGVTCRNLITGESLDRQPAHQVRLPPAAALTDADVES